MHSVRHAEPKQYSLWLLAIIFIVNERYHKLLLRCVQFCAVKLSKSRFLSDDHKFFITHIYTALFFRFPCSTAQLIAAVLDTTATLERSEEEESGNNKGDAGSDANGHSSSTSPPTAMRLPHLRPHHVTSSSSDKVAKRRPQRKSTLRGYRSPRGHCRHWNALSGERDESEGAIAVANKPTEEGDGFDNERRMAIAKQNAFEAFGVYKANRSTDDLLHQRVLLDGSPAPLFKKGARSVEASLELAFQQVLLESCI